MHAHRCFLPARMMITLLVLGVVLLCREPAGIGLLRCCLAMGHGEARAADESDPYQSRRADMVEEQIRARGVRSAAVLDAMTRVPRHLFVPEAAIKYAYDDTPLPIGYGQTISQPYIVGFMTEMLNLQPHARVLEVGTGSGYQAAVLAELGVEVYTIEIIAELAQSAADRLRTHYPQNVHARQADGFFGWPEKAPFDAIMVTAAAEFIPPPLLEQLKEGGRMVIPVGTPFLVQTLMLVEKSNGEIITRSLFSVSFVPLRRAP
jgi:protein-L-isoaspartate(D-aspartate) O-methyltransferase